MLRKSNYCVKVVTLKKCNKVLSQKTNLLKKSQHIGEEKPPFEKNSQIRLMIRFNLKLFSPRYSLTLISIHGESHEIIFPEMFPHPDKYSRGISYKHLTGWPKPTEEEVIRLCLCHTIFIIFKAVCITNEKTIPVPASNS